MWIDVYYDNHTQSIFCSNCGKILKDNEKITRFCSDCGASSTDEYGHPTSETVNLFELIGTLNSSTLMDLSYDIKSILDERGVK